MRSIKFNKKVLKSDVNDLKQYVGEIECPIDYNGLNSISKEINIKETAQYYNIDITIYLDEQGDNVEL